MLGSFIQTFELLKPQKESHLCFIITSKRKLQDKHPGHEPIHLLQQEGMHDNRVLFVESISKQQKQLRWQIVNSSPVLLLGRSHRKYKGILNSNKTDLNTFRDKIIWSILTRSIQIMLLYSASHARSTDLVSLLLSLACLSCRHVLHMMALISKLLCPGICA